MIYVSTLPIVQKFNESKNGSQIILAIYLVGDSFVYSINCKLHRFIHSYFPTKESNKYPTQRAAQIAAVNHIKSWIGNNRKLNALLQEFELAKYDQPSLFDDL